MRLTAGLLTHNDERYAARCLETLVAQTGLGNLNGDWQVVVLDNASTEQAYLSALQGQFPTVQFMKEQTNHGFAKGHNIIMRRYPAEFHAVLNIDVLFSPDFLAKLVEALEREPRFGSATGKLLYWDPGSHPEKTNIIDSCGIHMTKAHAFLDRGQGRIDTAFTPNEYDTPGVCFGGSGAATVYRRSALESVAYKTVPHSASRTPHSEFFDERMFMYKEDVDLAYRLMSRGHFCIFVSQAIAWHARTTSKPRRKRSGQERIWSAAHESLILRKHRKQWSRSTRYRTMLRQGCKWSYLLMAEPSVFLGARRLLREIGAEHRPPSSRPSS